MLLVLTVFITIGFNCVSFFVCSFTNLFKTVTDSYKALILAELFINIELQRKELLK